ncbi:MAG: ATP-dependent DNA helicase, partial [Candidatus Hodarchaeota archaeon]
YELFLPMVIRINDDDKTCKLSVRDLLTKNPFGYAPSLTPKVRGRMASGQEIHTTYQEMRKRNLKDDYVSEKVVNYATYVEGYDISIEGRIDGYYQKNTKIVLEEIKGVPRRLDIEAVQAEPFFQNYVYQAQIYAFIIHRTLSVPLEDITCFLVLIGSEDASVQRFKVKSEDMTKFIHDQTKLILRAWRLQQNIKQQKALLAQQLRFPFPNVRKYQDEMMNDVLSACDNQSHLLANAPTGIGKTISVLFPALKFALTNGKRLFFVTSKTTQQKLVVETLNQFSQQTVDFCAVLLQAKDKICLNYETFCQEDFCIYLRNYTQKKMGPYIAQLMTKKVVTPNAVLKIAKKEKICPFELALDLALDCDTIIGDYNYVFHPTVYLQRFFDSKYDDCICIVDEAHNLYARGLDYYSPSIKKKEIDNILVGLAKLKVRRKRSRVLEDIEFFLEGIKRYLENLSKTRRPSREGKFLVSIKKDSFKKWWRLFDKELIRAYSRWQRRENIQNKDDPIFDFYYKFKSFYEVLKIKGANFAHFFDVNAHSLNILCLDPSRELGRRIKGFHSCIAMSATLTPIKFFEEVLGFDPKRTNKRSYPSPFPKVNRKVLVLPWVNTKYQERSKHYKSIAEIIRSVISTRKGNWAVFFPSFDFLAQVQKHIPQSGNIIVQQQQMSEALRAKVLEKLRSLKENLLVLAVQGGIFSEGVDYPGEILIGVIVVGPALPKYAFEQELIKEYYNEKYRKGFEYAYRNPGMNRVIQAAGRVIRTSTDKGVMILIGERFATPYYASLFPSDWYELDPRELIVKKEDYLTLIRAFWTRVSNT